MRRISLKTWLATSSAVLAAFVVGIIAVATFVVVTDGMNRLADDASRSLAASARNQVRAAVVSAEAKAKAEDAPQTAGRERFRAAFLSELPVLLAAIAPPGSEFALYDADLDLLWDSGEAGVVEDLAGARAQALRSDKVTESHPHRRLTAGLFADADLGTHVVHSPVELPGSERMVLDVVYFARREEAVIDEVRAPMLVISSLALLLAVAASQLSIGRLLRRVDSLRKTADSIGSGQLDVKLPVLGDDEIGDLAASINRLIEQLRRRSETQARFVADASHELATPVAGIRGYINILRVWGADDPDIRAESIEAIDRESQRMSRLCNDLLLLIRGGEGLVYRHERLDVNALGRDALIGAAVRYPEKRLELMGPGDGQLPMIGDPGHIGDVISVLVDNAAKYTPVGGRVTLRTARRRGLIEIEVSDNGPGIPPEELDSIFDRFYRRDSSRSKETGGFGLGLAIAKSLVEGMGGTISVTSRMGQGSTFTVRVSRGRP